MPDADSASDGATCAVCRQPITDAYYEAAGRPFCASCRDTLLDANVTGVAPAQFVRAGLFGLVGAIGGAAVYYAVLATTGYEVGLIAILVGFMVGYTVRKGAHGLGGRRYQLLAVMLTYLAIGGTYVPLALREAGDSAAAAADVAAKAGGEESVPEPVPLFVAIAVLAAVAAALPIMVIIFGFPESIISALIIGYALHQAWRMNGRLTLTFNGPFTMGGSP